MSDQKQQTVEAGVVVPFFQASVSGLLFGLVLGILAWALDWPRPWVFGLIGGVAAIFVAWLSLLGRWLSWIEALLGVDLNRDGVISRNLSDERLRVAVLDRDGTRGVFLDLPIDEGRMIALADGLMRGKSLSESSWIGSQGIFSRSEFYALRDELIKRGLLRWVNPRAHSQGVELTPGGRALVRHFASISASPPRQLVDALPAHNRER